MKDKNGKTLAVGDTVLIRAAVLDIDESDCALPLKVGTDYCSMWIDEETPVERVGPVKQFAAFSDGINDEPEAIIGDYEIIAAVLLGLTDDDNEWFDAAEVGDHRIDDGWYFVRLKDAE